MVKRILFGGGAAGALTAAYLVGSLSLGAAFAQTTPSPSLAATSTAQPASPTAPQTGDHADLADEPTEATALASQAKITPDQAGAAALARFPGATVGRIELDNDNGGIVYSVSLTDTAGTRQDVSVDATSGTLLATHAETPETPGPPEGPETDGD